MAEGRRVILFSNQSSIQPVAQGLRAAGFEVAVVAEQRLLMREVRNARDRVVLLDFASNDVEGIDLLREIKYLEGSIQVLVINAEPRVYAGIQVFRLGGEACFFGPTPPLDELCEALEDVFRKIARWWRSLQVVGASRSAAAVSSEEGATVEARYDEPQPDRYPRADEEVELIVRGNRLKGRAVTASQTGMDLLTAGGPIPALFDKVLLRYGGIVSRGVVRRGASHPSGGWLMGIEWGNTTKPAAGLAGARAEQALFVTVDGYRVVARSLVAVEGDMIYARLANGRVQAVPTNAVRAMTRLERQADLLETEDFSFLVSFYGLEAVSGLTAIAQAIMGIEFSLDEG